MTPAPPLSESTVARTIRRAYPGAVWSSITGKWLVPAEALLQKEFECRRMKGEPPLWGEVAGRVHE